MSDPTLVFLPWVDRGGAADRPPDVRDAHPASEVTTTAAVAVNGSQPVPMPIRIMGPGEVTAIAPQQIIRTDPAPGTRTFESNYLALVEFDEPSLPWLFTPASALAGQLRPWLCLVVVAVGPGVRLDPPGRSPLPVLRIGPPAQPHVELPDLDDSWAWAHAQVAPADTTGPALTAALGGDPARNLSRLVCGRLLSAQTEYLACVVPTFEAGRRAGLGDDTAGAQGPAWTLAPDMDPVELPVYHHWRFATGEAGDFQSLALAIRGRTVPDTFGSRPIDLSTAGLGLTGTDDAQIRLGGALAGARRRPGRLVRPVAARPVRHGADDGAQHAGPVPGRCPGARPAALRRRLPAGPDARPCGGPLVRTAQPRPVRSGRRCPRRAGGAARPGDARGVGVGPGRRSPRRRRRRAVDRCRDRGRRADAGQAPRAIGRRRRRVRDGTAARPPASSRRT